MRPALRFWGSALAAALLFAWATRLFLPYEALGLPPGGLRQRAWLLTLWTGGVMGVCFGLAGLLGYHAPLGFREVAEAGTLARASESRRAARGRGAGFHANFAWWLVSTGGLLLGAYFLAWGVGRS